jgi:hypothetical protein
MLVAGQLFVLPTRSTGEPLADLVHAVPATANTLIVLDADRLFASKLAVSEEWRANFDRAFASGMVAIPGDTSRLVLASQLDFEFMKPLWQVSAADLQSPRSAAGVARATKGKLDSVGGKPAVALKQNAYLVELSPRQFVAMTPANRQVMARLLGDAGSRREPAVSPYLKSALEATRRSMIVIAIDLEDAIPPEVIRRKLAASSAVTDKSGKREAVATVLDGLKGLTFEIAVNEASYAQVAFDFRVDAASLAPIAKPLFQEVLSGLGAELPDVEGWKTQASATRLELHGSLSAAGRRRVLSLIDNPLASLVGVDDATATEKQPDHSKVVAATQKYLKAVQSTMDEVREQSQEAKTFSQNALWFDQWARRLDNLPVLNVDPELVDFTSKVTTDMRGIAAALRGIGIQSGSREAQVWSSYSYSYYTDDQEVGSQRRAIRAEERASGATNARELARAIDTALGQMRKDLTQKYKVEFSK